MSAPDDTDLLQKWTRHRDRESLGELIRRHIDLVYAVARRQVGDAHLAEDVTQAVFILLLQKAHQIKSEAAMTSWLFTTTRYAAANATKVLRRRRHHEHYASRHEQMTIDEPLMDDHSSPLLDEAIETLPRADRACILMSFMQQKTHAQVGAAIGVTEEAARKRITRAVDRLRAFFVSRGVTMSTTALIASFSTQSKASAALVESTINLTILSQSASAATAAGTIAKGVANMIFTAKLKLAAAAAIAMATTGFVTGQVVHHLMAPAMVATTTLQAAPEAPIPAQPSAPSSDTVSLPDGVTVQFAGVAPFEAPIDGWFTIAGKSTPSPIGAKFPKFFMQPAPQYQTVVRFTGPEDAIVAVSILQSAGSGSSSPDSLRPPRDYLSVFRMPEGVTSADIQVRIADGPWQTALRTRPGPGVSASGGNGFGATFTPLMERNGKAIVYVSITGSDPWRLIAKETTGEMHIGQSRGGAGSGAVTTNEYEFDVPAALISTLEIQTRPYNKRVIARNVTLDPTKPTTPKIEVEAPAVGK